MTAATTAKPRAVPNKAELSRATRQHIKGAPLRMVDSDKIDPMLFTAKKTMASPYRDALVTLVAATREAAVAQPPKKQPMLEVDSLTARGRFKAIADKQSIKILFAEQDGRLYVKLDVPNSASSAILDMLAKRPMNKIEIAAGLAALGLAQVDVAKELQMLSDNSRVRLVSASGCWQIAK